MSEHVRQHWIPDTYLDAWCDPDPARQNPRRVHRYGIDGRYLNYRPPSRIFTVDDLYTVPGPDGGRNVMTELALHKLEERFARIRGNYLLKSLPLPPPSRRDLLWFIAALRNRSPAMHTQQAAFYDQVLEIATATEDSIKAMYPQERAKLIEQTRRMPILRADDNKSVPLSTFRKMAAQPFGAYLPGNIIIEAELLEQMHLVILRIPAGESLITSDQPVVWWDPDPPPSMNRLGLRRQTIEITVPLTPSLCALISHRPGPDYADIDVEGVIILNYRTLNRAREVFIANRPDLVVSP